MGRRKGSELDPTCPLCGAKRPSNMRLLAHIIEHHLDGELGDPGLCFCGHMPYSEGLEWHWQIYGGLEAHLLRHLLNLDPEVPPF